VNPYQEGTPPLNLGDVWVPDEKWAALTEKSGRAYHSTTYPRDAMLHRDGVAWNDSRVRLDGWRGRFPFHVFHRSQTVGWMDWFYVREWCRCGAVRDPVVERKWLRFDR
jgi:hypothetical protein